MSSNDILILKEFKNNLVAFFDELIEIFPTEGDFIRMRIFFKDQTDIKEVMETFTYFLNKDEQILKNNIKERNESYFFDTDLFDAFDKTRVIHFKKIWRSPNVDADFKITIWKWVDSFVYLSDKYKKTKAI